MPGKPAAIFDPYLDTLGGGERYSLTLAKVLDGLGWPVNVLWNGDRQILEKAQSRFGMDLSKIHLAENFFSDDHLSSVEKWRRSRQYRFLFYVSDGSVPFLGSRVSWLHFQIPFHGVGGKSLPNRLKLAKISRVVTNSLFTKRVVDGEYGVNSRVIYPPVDTRSLMEAEKINQILSVGRYSALLQEKQQELLVKTFCRLQDEGLTGWRLVLAGGAGVGVDQNQLQNLQRLARGYAIRFVFNPTFTQLQQLYGESKIFWNATGYGQDEQLHPEKVEHFGITLVEAMSAGVVPLAVRRGGFPEILEKSPELLWNKAEDLKNQTLNLIRKPQLLVMLRPQMRHRALDFSVKQFTIRVKESLEHDLHQ